VRRSAADQAIQGEHRMNRSAVRLFAVLVSAAFAAPGAARATDLSWSALGGYQQGAGLRVTGTISRLAPNLPIAVQFGAGYALVDPGKPEAARRTFINDNTDGTPEESGHVWDLRADLAWLLGKAGVFDELGLFVGPRYSMFTGRFHFVGGNEDFLVESNAWGVGVGARGEVKLNPRWSLAGTLGLDWFPRTTIYSHDTSYSSTGYVVNGHHAYGFGDADKAINQPKLVPSLLVGVAWRP
jgi:hypothetical protein